MGGKPCDLGVAACVVNQDKILLVKENRGNYSSKWSLPKGMVDSGELPANAALRELKEECGIDGEVIGIIALRERVHAEQTGVFIAYSVRPKSLDVKIDFDEIGDFGWYSKDEFSSLVWVSDAMKEIAITALEPNSMELIDYSQERMQPYLLHTNRN